MVLKDRIERIFSEIAKPILSSCGTAPFVLTYRDIDLTCTVLQETTGIQFNYPTQHCCLWLPSIKKATLFRSEVRLFLIESVGSVFDDLDTDTKSGLDVMVNVIFGNY